MVQSFVAAKWEFFVVSPKKKFLKVLEVGDPHWPLIVSNMSRESWRHKNDAKDNYFQLALTRATSVLSHMHPTKWKHKMGKNILLPIGVAHRRYESYVPLFGFAWRSHCAANRRFMMNPIYPRVLICGPKIHWICARSKQNRHFAFFWDSYLQARNSKSV